MTKHMHANPNAIRAVTDAYVVNMAAMSRGLFRLAARLTHPCWKVSKGNSLSGRTVTMQLVRLHALVEQQTWSACRHKLVSVEGSTLCDNLAPTLVGLYEHFQTCGGVSSSTPGMYEKVGNHTRHDDGAWVHRDVKATGG